MQAYTLNRNGQGGSLGIGSAWKPEFNKTDDEGNNYHWSETGFHICVDENSILPLTVFYVNGTEWVQKSFFPQWNPDIIKGLRATNSNIKIGY